MNNHEHNDPNLDAPEKLRAALIQSQSRRVIVPPAVDDAVLRTAREHLDSVVGQASRLSGESSELPRTSQAPNQQQTGEAVSLPPSDGDRAGVRGFGWLEELLTGLAAFFGGRRFAPFTAAVATIVAAGVLVWLTVHPRPALRPEDLNADGQVDMLDAFALARELQQGSTPRPQLDLNGDGVVDDRDVQALANRAVSLEPGGRS